MTSLRRVTLRAERYNPVFVDGGIIVGYGGGVQSETLENVQSEDFQRWNVRLEQCGFGSRMLSSMKLLEV